MRALLSLVLVLAACCLGVETAAGQARAWPVPDDPPTDEELDRARALYELGTEAAEAHRWADALSSFEQSYALSGASPALYSIGFALRVLGRFREARDAFDQLLTLHPEVEPSIRQEAERLRQEVAARVAVLSLVGLPDPPPLASVRIDAETVADDGERPLNVETDPGHHVLLVELAGHEPFEWDGNVAPGDRQAVQVALAPRDEGGTIDDGGEDGDLLSRPAFWIAVGAAAALAAGIVVGVLVYESAQLDPRTEEHITL